MKNCIITLIGEQDQLKEQMIGFTEEVIKLLRKAQAENESPLLIGCIGYVVAEILITQEQRKNNDTPNE